MAEWRREERRTETMRQVITGKVHLICKSMQDQDGRQFQTAVRTRWRILPRRYERQLHWLSRTGATGLARARWIQDDHLSGMIPVYRQTALTGRNDRMRAQTVEPHTAVHLLLAGVLHDLPHVVIQAHVRLTTLTLVHAKIRYTALLLVDIPRLRHLLLVPPSFHLVGPAHRPEMDGHPALLRTHESEEGAHDHAPPSVGIKKRSRQPARFLTRHVVALHATVRINLWTPLVAQLESHIPPSVDPSHPQCGDELRHMSA